jgi:hypothetical protein
MYLGRYQRGEVLPIHLTAKTTAGVPTAPDQCPAYQIRNETPSTVDSGFIGQKDRYEHTAFFLQPVLLDHSFAAGRYTIVKQWMISSSVQVEQDTFQVLSSGDPNGAGIALTMHEGEGTNAALLHSQSGRIRRLRNPRAL